jgi:hypothetical protein
MQKDTKSKLPPLDLKEEKDKYEALYETKEVKFEKCKHKGVKFQNGMLVCPCGASWSGPRLQELFDLLTKRK